MDQAQKSFHNITWEAFEAYLITDRDIKVNTANISGHRSYFNKVKRHFADIDFTNDTIRLYVLQMTKDGVSPSTQNKIIQMIRSVNRCFDLGVNITIGRRHELEHDFEVLTDDEIVKICEVKIPYAKEAKYLNARYEAFYKLAGLNGGNRFTEAAVLKWSDLRVAPRKSVMFGDTKNRTRREVFLSDEVFNLINALERRGELIFCSYRGGKKLNSQEVCKDIRRRAEAIGIDPIRVPRLQFYTLRHSWATNTYDNPDNGLRDLDIAETMGHKDVNNLAKYRKKNLETSKRVILANTKLQHEKPVDEILLEIRRNIRRLTHGDPRFNQFAPDEAVLLEKLLSAKAA